MSLSVSTSRLSNWTTTRSTIVARSIGAMSMSGAAVTSIPPEWIERWRGKPSIRAQNSSQRSQSREADRRAAAGLRAAARARSGRPTTGSCRGALRRRDGRRRIPARRAARAVRRAVLPPARGGGSSWPLSGSIRRPSMSGGATSRSASAWIARPAARPQPGDARRRVARAALVVRTAARPDRRSDRRERLVAEGRAGVRLDVAPGARRTAAARPGSSGFGGWRQGGTFPTSGTRVFSWPIPSTSPRASAASAAPAPRPAAAPRPAVGRTRRTRRPPRGRAGP